jgi:hypothetical protein
MKPLPLPVRIAAGLVATAVDQARDLPRLVVEFPVTAVSQALQVTMRVQQKVTELAIKGDRALGTLRPVEEKPSWATFDEDEPPRRNGASTVTELRPQVPRTSTPIPVAQPPARKPAAASAPPKPAAPKPVTPKPAAPKPAAPKPAAPKPAASEQATAKPATPKPAAPKPAAAKPAAAKPAASEQATAKPATAEPGAIKPAAGPKSTPAPATPAPATPVPAPAATPEAATPALVVPEPSAPTPASPVAEGGTSPAKGSGDGPAPLPGYPDLTIPQLRGKLRFLSAADLTTLLDWETSHANRAPYLTMLSNRIATVTES